LTRLNDLAREYEAEGPDTARERALRWIQTFAHEEPGADLLLVVERGHRPGRKGPVRVAVEKLLEELRGGLVEWWQPFADGSLALRVARDPRRWVPRARPQEPEGDGRTPETAGAAYVPAEDDIPPEILPLARRIAEMRRTREGLGVSVVSVMMRQIWIQAQATAMSERISFEDALGRIRRQEEARMYEED
jgi:hypothetical protein